MASTVSTGVVQGSSLEYPLLSPWLEFRSTILYLPLTQYPSVTIVCGTRLFCRPTSSIKREKGEGKGPVLSDPSEDPPD